MKTVNIMGVNIAVVSAIALSETVKAYLGGKEAQTISKLNTEFLTRATRNEDFLKTLNSSGITIADGRGVLWAAKYLTLPIQNTKYKTQKAMIAIWQMIYSGVAIVFNSKFITYPIQENIPGVDALKLMIRVAEETDSGVFFFGASQQDLDGAIANIHKEMPGLKISGSLNGYDFQADRTINPVDVINKTDANLLIVALGSPMQEYWIRDNMTKLKGVRVAVGEGGSLAFLSGTFKRAPKWAQRTGLEWLWRLFFNKSLTAQTGSRLKRVWNAVPVFIYEVVKWKIKYGAIEVK